MSATGARLGTGDLPGTGDLLDAGNSSRGDNSLSTDDLLEACNCQGNTTGRSLEITVHGLDVLGRKAGPDWEAGAENGVGSGDDSLGQEITKPEKVLSGCGGFQSNSCSESHGERHKGQQKPCIQRSGSAYEAILL